MKHETPRISFIIPAHNLGAYLPSCLESIFSQPFEAWEIILVDDCSIDGTRLLCDRYAEKDSRISVLHLPANLGPGPARNEGLSLAAGEYVYFMDGDDTIAAGELPRLWEAICGCGSPDIMHVDYRELFALSAAPEPPESFNAPEVFHSPDEFLLAFSEKRISGFYLWQFVMHRRMLLDNGLTFRPTLLGEDIDFVIRSLFSAKSIGLYGKIFYYWRTRLSGSLTSAHIACWDHLVKAAAGILEFACESPLSGPQREWVLRIVCSLIGQFETIAGAVPPEETERLADSFGSIQKYMPELKRFQTGDGLLDRIAGLGAREGPAAFCRQKAEEARKMLSGKAAGNLFGFPATRKCTRLMGVLAANGYTSKGLLDNDSQKQGLMLDGLPILNPRVIPLCYGDGEGAFVVICTSTKRTGDILAGQLRGYGLEEGKHFTLTGFDID